MLGAVEYQYSSINAHCGYDVWILWLVSCLVDFSRMIYLLLDVHLDSRLFSTRGWVAITTNLSTFLIIVMWIRCNVLWELDVCDLEIVWCAIRCMGTD